MNLKPSNRQSPRERPPVWPWKAALTTWFGAWLVLALLLLVPLMEVRERIRDQLAFQRALTLQAVAMSRLEEDDMATEQSVSFEASKLEGVLGIRFYDSSGEFIGFFPESVESAEDLRPVQMKTLKKNVPLTKYLESPDWRRFFIDTARSESESPASSPLLLVYLPLRHPLDSEVGTISEFIIEGVSIQREYLELDSYFRGQILVLLIGGAALLALIIAAAYHRNYRSNLALIRRTQDLLKANHELTLAAKTSAVGSITAHLLHGIKNPVQGLRSFVRSKSSTPREDTSDTEWLLASQTVERLQEQINNVVRVLQESDNQIQYEIRLSELLDLLRRKLDSRNAGVTPQIQCDLTVDPNLENHPANLILLILENLLANASDAARQHVRLLVRSTGDDLLFQVEDDGPGIPGSIRDRLFTPVPSDKKNGNGIGLALCRQLTSHLRAKLTLLSTGAKGTTFTLKMPIERLQTQNDPFMQI